MIESVPAGQETRRQLMRPWARLMGSGAIGNFDEGGRRL